VFRVTDGVGQTLSYKCFKFSGGEVQVKVISSIAALEDITIFAKIQSADQIMELILLTDAIRRASHARLSLICPYLPYARQDRVCACGEALALRAMCDIINSLHFERVTVWDVHSDVALALLDNVRNIKQVDFLHRFRVANQILVAPDAGASKKIVEIAKFKNMAYVQAEKVRDVQTGEITGTKVHSGSVGEMDFLIVDDICDGGRTFIELARELKTLTTGQVYLYVTHGIFSKGLDVFDGLIDRIYCPNIFDGVDINHPLLQLVLVEAQ
jgi:ribose-phosphate pyrophosphokinase